MLDWRPLFFHVKCNIHIKHLAQSKDILLAITVIYYSFHKQCSNNLEHKSQYISLSILEKVFLYKRKGIGKAFTMVRSLQQSELQGDTGMQSKSELKAGPENL